MTGDVSSADEILRQFGQGRAFARTGQATKAGKPVGTGHNMRQSLPLVRTRGVQDGS